MDSKLRRRIKRKRCGTKKESYLDSLRQRQEILNKKSLELMQLKHKERMETLASMVGMCNTVNSFFSRLLREYDKISPKHS